MVGDTASINVYTACVYKSYIKIIRFLHLRCIQLPLAKMTRNCHSRNTTHTVIAKYIKTIENNHLV